MKRSSSHFIKQCVLCLFCSNNPPLRHRYKNIFSTVAPIFNLVVIISAPFDNILFVWDHKSCHVSGLFEAWWTDIRRAHGPLAGQFWVFLLPEASL